MARPIKRTVRKAAIKLLSKKYFRRNHGELGAQSRRLYYYAKQLRAEGIEQTTIGDMVLKSRQEEAPFLREYTVPEDQIKAGIQVISDFRDMEKSKQLAGNVAKQIAITQRYASMKKSGALKRWKHNAKQK